jgi:hypothetical protein
MVSHILIFRCLVITHWCQNSFNLKLPWWEQESLGRPVCKTPRKTWFSNIKIWLLLNLIYICEALWLLDECLSFNTSFTCQFLRVVITSLPLSRPLEESLIAFWGAKAPSLVNTEVWNGKIMILNIMVASVLKIQLTFSLWTHYRGNFLAFHRYSLRILAGTLTILNEVSLVSLQFL